MLHWPKKSLVMPFYYFFYYNINFDQNGPLYFTDLFKKGFLFYRNVKIYGKAIPRFDD